MRRMYEEDGPGCDRHLVCQGEQTSFDNSSRLSNNSIAVPRRPGRLLWSSKVIKGFNSAEIRTGTRFFMYVQPRGRLVVKDGSTALVQRLQRTNHHHHEPTSKLFQPSRFSDKNISAAKHCIRTIFGIVRDRRRIKLQNGQAASRGPVNSDFSNQLEPRVCLPHGDYLQTAWRHIHAMQLPVGMVHTAFANLTTMAT